MRRASRLLPSTTVGILTPRPRHSPFSSASRFRKDEHAEKARELNQKGLDEQEKSFNSQIDSAVGEARELQKKAPWHRAGSDEPPVEKLRKASTITKGYYYTVIILRVDVLICTQESC